MCAKLRTLPIPHAAHKVCLFLCAEKYRKLNAGTATIKIVSSRTAVIPIMKKGRSMDI